MNFIKQNYLSFLNDTFTFKVLNDSIIEIHTPFICMDNDLIYIYLNIKDNDTLILSDDDLICYKLMLKDLDFNSLIIKTKLDFIIKNYNLEIVENRIICKCNKNNLKHKLFEFIQGIINLEMLINII